MYPILIEANPISGDYVRFTSAEDSNVRRLSCVNDWADFVLDNKHSPMATERLKSFATDQSWYTKRRPLLHWGNNKDHIDESSYWIDKAFSGQEMSGIFKHSEKIMTMQYINGQPWTDHLALLARHDGGYYIFRMFVSPSYSSLRRKDPEVVVTAEVGRIRQPKLLSEILQVLRVEPLEHGLDVEALWSATKWLYEAIVQ